MSKTSQTITRKGSFDSGHRVINECMKCFNMHGHTYIYHLTFEFNSMEDIGYAIDFKEIKRVACQWIDDVLDHGMILNPKDAVVIRAARETGSKLWLMSLNGKDKYCNPSVENIAKEIFLAMEVLFIKYEGLRIKKIKLYETPNCYTVCKANSTSDKERVFWNAQNYENVFEYASQKGMMEYDDRKIAEDPND